MVGMAGAPLGSQLAGCSICLIEADFCRQEQAQARSSSGCILNQVLAAARKLPLLGKRQVGGRMLLLQHGAEERSGQGQVRLSVDCVYLLE